MADRRYAILIAGVGGQGVLTAGRILGNAAHLAGLRVVEGQLHGMAQRGGSVECSVLIGPGQSSFLRVADLVLGFEPIETLRALRQVGPQTRVLVSSGRVMLDELSRAGRPYPSLDSIFAEIRGAVADLTVVDATAGSARVGAGRTLNIVMLGAASGLDLLPFDQATLWRAIVERSRPESHGPNRAAFDLGRGLVAPHEPTPAGTVPQPDSSLVQDRGAGSR